MSPGIKILNEESARLRQLRPRPESPVLDTYIGLFEPVLVLARARLQAGKGLDTQRGRELELLLASLTAEQVKFAKSFGFDKCRTGFFEALGGSP